MHNWDTSSDWGVWIGEYMDIKTLLPSARGNHGLMMVAAIGEESMDLEEY